MRACCASLRPKYAKCGCTISSSSAQRWSPRENGPGVTCPPAARSTRHLHVRRKPVGTSPPHRAGTARRFLRLPASPCPPQLAAGTWTNPLSAQTVSDSKIWMRTPANTLSLPFHQRQVPCVQRPHRRHEPITRCSIALPSLFPSSTHGANCSITAPQKRRAQNLCAPQLFLKRHVPPDDSPRDGDGLPPLDASPKSGRTPHRGKVPLCTSAQYPLTASRLFVHVGVLPRKFRRLPERQPSMSCSTRICPSQSGPAPIPMVGNPHTARDLRRQLSRQRFQHNRERTRSLHRPRIAQNLLRPARRLPLYAIAAQGVTDCGVSPTWPITGISASVSREISSSLRSPPSIFTASRPLPSRSVWRSAAPHSSRRGTSHTACPPPPRPVAHPAAPLSCDAAPLPA